MYSDTKTIKLFDSNHKFVDTFDEEIEKILISVHGENYYDIDEDLIISNDSDEMYHDSELEKTIELVDSLVVEDAPKITIVEKDKHKAHIKDFVPVLFFICITIVIIAAGYYFLNNVDLMGLIS